MTVEWVGTSLTTGRFAAPRETAESELLTYFDVLRTRGEGYLEVCMPGLEVPWLSLSFRGDQAVVHKVAGEESVALLVGDGSVSADDFVDVPVYDELSRFTGDFVSSVNRAWEVIQTFVRCGDPDGLGQWWEL